MTVTLDIPANIDQILNLRSREEHLDKMSVLRQLLHEGVETYLVHSYSNGKISKERLAELLDMDIYEVNELLEKYGVRSNISYKRFTRGIELAEKSRKYE